MPTLLNTLASYVPSLIIRRAAKDPALFTKPRAEWISAAVLFADVSGFTALTERLAARGPAGAEDLVALLNTYFGQLIELVTGYGGDIVKFAGDAVLALWPTDSGEDLATLTQQVAQCCLVIQQRLHDYQVAEDVRLSMKLAIGAGDVLTETLGGVFGRWEFLVAGQPFSQVGTGNSYAKAGQIMISPEAWALVKDRCVGQPAGDGQVCLEAVREPLPISPAARPEPVAEATAVLRAFIPGAIRSRLDAGQTDWLAELRRVTVLFINLPDFNYNTPLDQAQKAMAALQTDLYRYEGSINKISVDDKGASLVAVLGLPPLSHEDDSARGVRAALAMQAELRRSELRSAIGVTTGLAFCGSVGNATRREYTLMGDIVNLAARLMQAAPGEILCDEPTAQAAMGRLIFNPLPPLKVKGKKEPVAVYKPALEESPPRIKKLISKPKADMIGRAKERALLAEQLQSLLNSKKGSRIVIEGEAGIGKSRLLEDMIAQAHEMGLTVLSGSGDSIETTTPYYVWRQVFAQIFNLGESSNDPAAIRTHILNQLPHDPKILQLAPLLNILLPFDWPDNEFTKQMTGKVRAENTSQLLVSLLQDIAKKVPPALIIEDAHWLDSASLALLSLVGQRVQPLMLVISMRPIADPLPAGYSELLNAPGTERLLLENLTPEEALTLVCRRLGVESLPEQVGTIIREKAEGNPFFSEELAFAMRDGGMITIADGQCRLASGLGDKLSSSFPDTIQGVITSRIDRLTASQQLTLKVASVIGRVFSYKTLHDIFPIDDDRANILVYFDVLQRLDLTPLEKPAPDLAYIFKHIITHEVAYNLMLFSQRRQLHRAVAEWYERTYASDLSPFYPFLAYHWRKAAEDRTTNPELLLRAIDYLKKAGDHAVHHYVNEEAMGFYNEALELLTTLPEAPEREQLELQLQLAVGALLIETRGYAAIEVEQAYSRARELCGQVGDNVHLFPALRGLWAFHIGRADYHEARELAEQLLRLAENERDQSILLEAHRALGNTLFWLGDLAGAQKHMELGITLYVPDEHRTLAFLYGQDPDVANRGMQAWPLGLLGYPEQALKRGREAIAHAHQISHPYSLGYALVHDMCCHQYLRLAQVAYKRAEEAISLATEKGFPNWLLAGFVVRGWALAQKGQAEEGITQIRDTVNIWRSTGSELVVPYFLAMLAEAYGKAGQFKEGLDTLADALSVALKNDDHWYEAELYRLKGEFLLEQGGTEAEVEACFQQAIDLARSQRAKLLELRASVSLGHLWQKQEKRDKAREALSGIYNWFTEGFNMPDLKQAKALLTDL